MAFVKDILEKPAYIFYRKYLLLPAIVLFAIVGLNVAINLIVNQQGNLVSISGRLDRTQIIVKNRLKGSDDYELRIFLRGIRNYYSLTTKKKKAAYYQENLRLGDSLFLKVPSVTYKFFSAKPNVIFELSNVNKTLLSFNEERKEQEINILIVILAEAFFIWIYVRSKQNKPTYI
jgi:hypothetical protein